MAKTNPFITSGYNGAEYFCDRVEETAKITKWLINSNNIALISPRRYGKTDLIRHCFAQPEIASNYYTFIIDIYSAKSFAEVVKMMSEAIVNTLKSKSQKALDAFLGILQSLRGGFSYDWAGIPSFNIGIGDIHSPETTMGEIFEYLNKADKPCLVAIDEFQQIAKIDDNIEAIFRTYVQYCNNATFIFSGSQRHIMGDMFTSPKRPFYQSTTLFYLGRLPMDKYAEFCRHHFENAGKHIKDGVASELYDRFDGVTYYMQRIMNEMFSNTERGEWCEASDIDFAIRNILDVSAPIYENMMYQLPDKQQMVLRAIAADGIATKPMSAQFVKSHNLPSPSSVKSALPALLDKDLLTTDKEGYRLCDKFLEIWLK